MYKTNDGILHTFTTNNYSMREMSTQIIVPGHAQHSLPMLSEYYWARGMYDSSSSSSSDELPNPQNVVSDSVPSTSLETSTSSIDIQYYLIDSTSDNEGAELLSTDMEFLMSSSSSFTSESSSPQFRCTYHDLVDYSPADVNQPQPTEDIYVPSETINNPQLRKPPVVSLQCSVSLDPQNLNNYFQDHFPQPTIDEEEDVTIFNSLPDYIEVSSENTDSNATIV